MDPVPDPILLEKFLGYSRESNPGPLGWLSDVLTTIPNRWSLCFTLGIIIEMEQKSCDEHVIYKLHVKMAYIQEQMMPTW